MRILHTSDWHLGRSFHRADLLGDQATFVDHLVAVVEEEAVDLVVVAGDVYDRALPPVDAVRLADEAIARLAASRARVVVTSGNHDSARRLGFGARVMDAAGVHVRTDPAQVGVPVLVPDADGAVAVYGLPYLDPDAVREPWALPARSHEAALGEAMRRVRADLAGRPGTRSVVLAHAFVAGAQPSESERDISVGGVQRVPVPVLDGVDYVAMGHLHASHVLTDRVRYSGSPLAYSFSEAGREKGSWLVDLAADGAVAATFLPTPVPRPLARLRGTLAELLADPSLAEHEAAWVEATLTDPERQRGAMERLRRRFPHALVLTHEPVGGAAPAAPHRPVAGRSPHDVTLDFVRHVRGSDASADEAALLASACEACTGDADATREAAAG
ncbi:exonuclease SbcCD subunit D [Nocardioides sp. ChNu-153]|uniref:exonuclease SbcCD subunit D n=1 Tax=unclassified Nocardioides TaxID=2615069 RepID=UPI0024074F06|nr:MULTISPECIES: exonuclease SbcCD subunit D [unclassified Nocardioides]MDF9718090.1 exonuclease SbcCD subunit D [Nocardioides sp. ChNu-99]MDN7122259.1 exonuclease SbcCD subunit D [Nocardioides sp. ChNu-153]